MSWHNFMSAAAAAMQSARARSTSLLRFADGSFTRSIEASAVDPREGCAFYDLVTPWPGVDAQRKTPDKLIFIEAERANLAPVSADFSDALWSKAGATVSQTETAPDGSPAWTITDSAAGYQTATLTWTAAVTGAHTLSCFIKKDAISARVPSFGIEQTGTGLITGGAVRIDVRTDTGVFVVRGGTATAVVEDAGDWWRLSATFTVSTAGTFGWRIAPASGTTLGAVDAAATGSVTPWNVQVEVGSHASSPIRTAGTEVTRTQDLMRWAGGVPPTELLETGFEIDFYPATGPGTIEARIGWQSASSVYVRIAGSSGDTLLSYRNGGSVTTSTRAIPHEPGDKLTLRVEHGVRYSVRVNDGEVVDYIDLSAEPDWSGRSADTLQLGGNGATHGAFGLYSEFRSIQPENELLHYSMMTFTRTGEASAVDPRNGWAFYQTGFAAEPDNYPLAENSDFVTGWTNGATVTTANTHAAPDGTLTADTITDDDGATNETINRTVTLVGRGSRLRLRVYVLKDADETRFPEFGLDEGGFTFRTQLNTATGAFADRGSTASDMSVTVEDAGLYWLLEMQCTATVTATSALVRIYPAITSVLTGVQVATTGSIVVADMEVAEFYDQAWMPTNAPRITSDNMLYVEGARTNNATQSEAIADGSGNWAADHASTTVTANATTAPDGGSDAERIQVPSGAFANYINSGAPAAGCWSAFLQAGPTSDGTHNFSRQDSNPTGTYAAGLLAAAWQRLVISATRQFSVLLDGRDCAAGGGVAAGARDAYVWGAQLESGTFPSSPIRTFNASATRNADTGSFAPKSWDTRINNGVWQVRVCPEWASTEPAASEFMYIAQCGAQGILYLFQNAGTMQVRMDRLGASILSQAITFSAGQQLTITVDWPASSVTVAGATTGNGTFALTGSPVDWGEDPVTDTLYLGRSSTNIRHFFGLISRPVAT